MGEAWIIDAVRTPRGKGKKDVGSLSGTHPQELMATTLRGLAARNTIDVKDVEGQIHRLRIRHSTRAGEKERSRLRGSGLQ